MDSAAKLGEMDGRVNQLRDFETREPRRTILLTGDGRSLASLDGRIDNEFFDSKAADFRGEQCRIMRDIGNHQNANRSYIDEGVSLPELAHWAHALFENQPPSEKRKLLNFRDFQSGG